MDALFFVNNKGKQVIPSPNLLRMASAICKPENLILPVSWNGFDLKSVGLGQISVLVDAEDSVEVSWVDREAIVCRSNKMLRRALRAPTAVVNGVAYKAWQKGFGSYLWRPEKTIVVITDGEHDPLPQDPVFCELGIPAKDIFFILESQLIGTSL